jgi:chemosensory pili system protein ChpA (sensor histidine kinase/response regulator)
MLGSSVPKWVLVADDDDSIRELWTEVLTRAGYRVLTARNGREALDLMRAAVPDLLILDLHMPEMDGQAVLDAFGSSPVFGRIPVLIVSGFLEDEAPGNSPRLNIVGRLPKPMRTTALLEAVRAGLANGHRVLAPSHRT